MASRRQKELDRLIDSAGAGVYDEESGCWSSCGDDESGWGFSSLTNIVKKAAGGVESVAKRGAGLTYGLAKRGASLASKPFVYTYKGVKYIGEKAMDLAMYPIRRVVGSYKNKMVNRKAKELANQRGLKAPGPAENSAAAAWAKDYTKHHLATFGPLVASMMGSPEASLMGCEDDLDGVMNLDEIEGVEDVGDLMGLDDDEMGGPYLIPLTVLGSVALGIMLVKVYNAAFAGHPAPDQAPPGEMDPSMMDPNAAAAYPGQVDPSMMDPSMMDPNAAAAYPDASPYQDPYAADASAYPPPGYYPQG